MPEPDPIDAAIRAVHDEDFLRALIIFNEVYGNEGWLPVQSSKAVAGLSYFGLAIALVQKKYKDAIDFCRRSIEVEFYKGEHYANLARVYIAAGNRKKAYETIEAGRKAAPEDEYLERVHQDMGVRSRPSVPFLKRENPINVSLGQARHAKKTQPVSKKRSED